MAGIVGCDHGSFARAVDEGPSVAGFEVVVVVAAVVGVVDSGVVGVVPFGAVVEFDAAAVAAFDGAFGARPQHGDLLCHRRATSEVGDVQHVDAFGDDEFGDGFAQQVAGDGGGDGTDARDLAHFARFDVAAHERVEIDT